MKHWPDPEEKYDSQSDLWEHTAIDDGITARTQDIKQDLCDLNTFNARVESKIESVLKDFSDTVAKKAAEKVNRLQPPAPGQQQTSSELMRIEQEISQELPQGELARRLWDAFPSEGGIWRLKPGSENDSISNTVSLRLVHLVAVIVYCKKFGINPDAFLSF
jgi:hypothetical protein